MPVNYPPTIRPSRPSNAEIALAAIMRADAAVLVERAIEQDGGCELARREKLRASRLGKKQSPEVVAKRVATRRRNQADLKSQSVVPPTEAIGRAAHG
jgi:hypothetical protein